MMTYTIPKCLILALCIGWLTVAVVYGGPETSDLEQIDALNPSGNSVSARDLPISMILEKAREFLDKNQLRAAEELYQIILIREQDHVAAMLDLATVYERMGRLEYARGLMIRASAIDFDNETVRRRSREISAKLSSVLHQEVDSLIAVKQYNYAIPKISILLTLEPENARLNFKKALCHYNVNRLEVALQDVEAAIKLRKELPFYQLRTDILERLNDKKVHSLIRQAGALLKKGTQQSKEEALTVLSKVLQLDPDNVWAKRQFMESNSSQSTTGTTGESATDGANNQLIPQVLRSAWPFLIWLSDILYHHIKWLCVILLVLLVYNSSIIQMFIKRFPTQSMLSGNLTHFKINETVTFINGNERTGTLRIISKSINGSIYFEKGDAMHCEVNNLTGKEALNYILKNAKKGRFSFTETKTPVKRTIDVPLSLILMGLSNRKQTSREKKMKRPPSRIKQLLDNR